MKIYTKRGDAGETDLFGGERVFKGHLRVKAYGDIDKANSALGMAVSLPNIEADLKEALIKILRLLFAVGAEIATAHKESAQHLLEKHLKNQINETHVNMLENAIDEAEDRLMPLKNFILPCGSDLSARLHFARTLVREAEISLWELQASEQNLRPEILRFFNRLSDYLFVLARVANQKAGIDDLLWSGNLDEVD
jgi:cob(I)alamin adenosyltransferase